MRIQFFLNLIGIVGMTTGLFSLHPWLSPLIVPVFMVLLFIAFIMAARRFGSDTRYRRAFSFFVPMALVMGFTSLLLFRDMNAVWHRLYGFLPFAFIVLGALIRIATIWQQRMYRLIVFSLLVMYLLGNGLTLYEQFRYDAGRGGDQILRARRVAVAIDASARGKGLVDADFSVVAYTPTDVWNYAVTPELYFLREMREYPVPFAWTGNDIDRAAWRNDNRPYIYLLCKEYTRAEDVERTCLGMFAARNPSYTLEERLLFVGDTTVFVFRRKDQ